MTTEKSKGQKTVKGAGKAQERRRKGAGRTQRGHVISEKRVKQ